jgi:hypothetical protein
LFFEKNLFKEDGTRKHVLLFAPGRDEGEGEDAAL